MPAFKKRRLVFIAGLAGATILAIVWLLSPPNEPRYQGRPLSFWANQLVYTTNNLPYTTTLSDAAAGAVREIGTNALPPLLHWMSYRENTTRFKVAQWLADKKAPVAVVSLLLPNSSPRGRAILCFQALGPDAKAAVPALARMLQEPEDARSAVRALCAIGKPGAAALRETLPTIPDPILRANIFNELFYGVSPEMQIELAPLLAQSLKEDSSYAVSMSAARILARFTNAAAVAVPALVAALRHKDGGTRFTAAISLRLYGKDAAAAIPQLESMLNDANPQVRIEVTNTLSVIQKAAMPAEGQP